MRVIAGVARGQQLKVPKGRDLRPTSDRVRSAIFSILASADAKLDRVLDLYAGTGALGIEALSRGAKHCDFVEQNSAACTAIRENLSKTGLSARGKVYCESLRAAQHHLPGPYTLILADPPYNDDGAVGEVLMLASSLLKSPDSMLVLEHSSRREPPQEWAQLALTLKRRYGDTAVAIYRPRGGVS